MITTYDLSKYYVFHGTAIFEYPELKGCAKAEFTETLRASSEEKAKEEIEEMFRDHSSDGGELISVSFDFVREICVGNN